MARPSCVFPDRSGTLFQTMTHLYVVDPLLMVTALCKSGFDRCIWDPFVFVLHLTPPRHELWPWQRAAADTVGPQ